MNNKLTVAGIISGVGNLLGFQQAGFKPLFLNDNRNFIKKGIDTVIRNMPGCKYSQDLFAFQEMNPTVLMSSPSCAQVSLLGMKREDRKSLKELKLEDFEFAQTLEIILQRKPEFFIIEYLKSILDHFKVTYKGLYREITDQFLEFPKEYRVQILELNAMSYGVPQNRRRLFIFFSKKQYDFVYVPPQKLTLELKKVGEVIEMLNHERDRTVLPNDEMPRHNPTRVARFDELEPGESYYGGQNNRRLKMEQYCPVITSHCTRHVHPIEPRVLNIRESATFQGFPLDFQFYGGDATKLDQIGKTVPPPVTKHFAEEIKESIERYESRNSKDN